MSSDDVSGTQDEGTRRTWRRPRFKIDEDLKRVAQVLKETKGGIGAWSIGDIVLGLYYLRRYKTSQFVPKSTDGAITDGDFLSTALHYARLANAAYERDADSVADTAKMPVRSVAVHEPRSTLARPGYAVLVDDARKEVVLAVRGTKTRHDAVADACAVADPFINGYCHHGIRNGAEFFARKLRPKLEEIQREHHGYSLVTVGHSLGGATAAMTCLLLRAETGQDVTCFAFAPPPCCDAAMAQFAAESSYQAAAAPRGKFVLCGRRRGRRRPASERPVVTTFVHDHDFVARVSLASLELLRQEVQAFPWLDHAREDIIKRRLVLIKTQTRNVADRVGAAVKRARHAVFPSSTSSASESLSGSDDDDEEEQEESETSEDSESQDWAEPDPNADEIVQTDGDRRSRTDVAMVLPGRVYHLFSAAGAYFLREEAAGEFSQISLFPTMFADHSMNAYVAALASLSR